MEKSNDLYRNILDHGASPSTLLFILKRIKEEGRGKEVVRECIKGLRQYPDDIPLRWLLSECYLESGFFSLAEKEIARAAETIEKLIPIFRVQADLFERQGRLSEASKALEKYLAHTSGDTETIEHFQRLKEKQETSSSLPPAPEKAAQDIVTHTLAEIYESQGQIQAAMDTYRQLVAQDSADLLAKERLQHLEAKGNLQGNIPEPSMAQQDRKVYMTDVLEGWLKSIQEIGGA